MNVRRLGTFCGSVALLWAGLWGGLMAELLFRSGALPVSQAHAQTPAVAHPGLGNVELVLVGVGLLQLLQSIGVVGWVRWSVERIAADRARAEVASHDSSPGAHVVAAEHNHRELKDRMGDLEGEVEKVEGKIDALRVDVENRLSSLRKDLGGKLSSVSARLGALLTQHLLMHRDRLPKRSTDGPDFELSALLEAEAGKRDEEEG